MTDLIWEQGREDPSGTAVSLFWQARDHQKESLPDGGKAGGGARSGAHMNGIRVLVESIFRAAGAQQEWLQREPFLPGYYRPRKKWDLAVRHQGVLIAALEFKSQVGSVGKNISNRFEEALGTATDTWAAHEKLRAFGAVPPWLAYVFVLQEDEETEKRDRSVSALFEADPGFKGMSYSERYQEMLSRFIADDIYQAGWFITTKRDESGKVSYAEPLKSATGETFRAAVEQRVASVRGLLT